MLMLLKDLRKYQEYIETLRIFLSDIPKNERERFINEYIDTLDDLYEEYVKSVTENDKNVGELFVSTLESPQEVAKKYKRELRGKDVPTKNLNYNFIRFLNFINTRPVLSGLFTGILIFLISSIFFWTYFYQNPIYFLNYYVFFVLFFGTIAIFIITAIISRNLSLRKGILIFLISSIFFWTYSYQNPIYFLNYFVFFVLFFGTIAIFIITAIISRNLSLRKSLVFSSSALTNFLLLGSLSMILHGIKVAHGILTYYFDARELFIDRIYPYDSKYYIDHYLDPYIIDWIFHFDTKFYINSHIDPLNIFLQLSLVILVLICFITFFIIIFSKNKKMIYLRRIIPLFIMSLSLFISLLIINPMAGIMSPNPIFEVEPESEIYDTYISGVPDSLQIDSPLFGNLTIKNAGILKYATNSTHVILKHAVNKPEVSYQYDEGIGILKLNNSIWDWKFNTSEEWMTQIRETNNTIQNGSFISITTEKNFYKENRTQGTSFQRIVIDMQTNRLVSYRGQGIFTGSDKLFGIYLYLVNLYKGPILQDLSLPIVIDILIWGSCTLLTNSIIILMEKKRF
jgi:hypothetical protein